MGIHTSKMAKPLFKPKPGQMDFTHARWAPVINCVVKHKGKMLLVKRSEDLNFYPGYWNGISGFLDDAQGLEEKVREELREELGIAPHNITKIIVGDIFDQEAPEYTKTWIVHPVLAEISTDALALDWEAAEHAWVSLKEARKYKLLPGFDTVLDKLEQLMTKP